MISYVSPMSSLVMYCMAPTDTCASQCNRRDAKFTHHASGKGAQKVAETYVANGASKDKIVVGFPMYGKAFPIKGTNCSGTGPDGVLGCELAEMEDAKGVDTGLSSAIRFNKAGNQPVDPKVKERMDKWFPAFESLYKEEDSKHLDSDANANVALLDGYIYSWQGKTALAAGCKAIMSGGYKGGFAWAAGQVGLDTKAQQSRTAHLQYTTLRSGCG